MISLLKVKIMFLLKLIILTCITFCYATNCSKNEFQCKNGTCIKSSKLCMGTPYCSHQEDLKICSEPFETNKRENLDCQEDSSLQYCSCPTTPGNEYTNHQYYYSMENFQDGVHGGYQCLNRMDLENIAEDIPIRSYKLIDTKRYFQVQMTLHTEQIGLCKNHQKIPRHSQFACNDNDGETTLFRCGAYNNLE